MGQALRRARGAAVKYAEEKSAPSEAARRAVASEDADRPIVLYTAGVRRVKTKEQLETEARWAAKAREMFGDPKSPPSPKSRLRAEEKQTDYRPEPPYDRSYSDPFPGYTPADQAAFDREWDKSDPNYKFMVQKAAGQVVSRTETVGGPGAQASKGPSFGYPARLSRAKVDEGEREGRVVPGKLNILQLKQAYLLYHGQANGPVKQLDVDGIAEKFEIKAEQLKLLFQYTGLAQGKPVDKSIFRGVARPPSK